MRLSSDRLGIISTIGVAVGISVCHVTRKKQEEAKSSGSHIPYGPYEAVFKRLFDIAASGLGLILFSPILGITALLVRMKLGKPIMFTQERPGLDGEIFTVYKFRTMDEQRDSNGKLLPDEIRLTPFGKKLRAASIDELPEFFNILKGDMSMVGPRPLLPEYLPRYNNVQKHRHDVRPGLTGYAQVSGRNQLNWEEKFKDDIEYVNHITFFTDLKILFNTVKIVLRKEGISSGTSATMEAFMGGDDI